MSSLVLQGAPLVAVRALFVAALLSAGGALTFRALVMPHVAARSADTAIAGARDALTRLTWTSLVVALFASFLWAVLQAADMADADRLRPALAALWPVLSSTQFGGLVLLQAALLVATCVLLLTGPLRLAACVAMGNVAAQAGHGHAMAMGGIPSLLFWTGVLHLLAAAAWIGGLLPLLLVIRLAPARSGALAARWFSPLGKWCVGILAGTALIQAWRLVGTFGALFGTPYGWMALVKTGCFGVLLGLAVVNRYELAPALLGEHPATARRRLIGSITLQTATGMLAILAATMLSGLTPGMDMGEGGS